MTTEQVQPVLDPQTMWQAVATRDPRVDGQFVYAVITTGIYCRPTCSSRRPYREHVRFFTRWADAEQAGFRPCKRCRPHVSSPRHDLIAAVERACAIIRSTERYPRLSELARSVGFSPFYFNRVFKSVLGVTPKEYAEAHRLGRLQIRLQECPNVTTAIYDAGFGSGSRVYERSTQLLGMTPAQYRAGGVGVRIHIALSPSSLGWVGVAASDKGFCAVELGDSERAVRERLLARFPRAAMGQADSALVHGVREIVRFIHAPDGGLALPLDIRGTAFQRRVWKALQEIPVGTTITYGDLARRIGMARGSRAVARACAANPVAVAIPCHRVIREDGALGGYR